MNLKGLQYYNELFICAYCAYCVNNQASCPTYHSTLHEIVTGRGKLITARNLSQGLIDSEEGLDALRDGLFLCTFCGACQENCIVDIPLTKVYSELKTLVQDRLPKYTIRVFENLNKEHNIYGLDQEDRDIWSYDIEELYDEWVNLHHETGFFLGCVYSYSGRAGRGPTAVLKLAKMANEKISIFSPSEYCCGNPYLLGGQKEKAKEFAEHNISEIQRLGIKDLIISCAGCYRVFTEEYPQLTGKDLPFNVISHMKYMKDLIKAKKINLSNDSPFKVTYKDPCELGRHSGVYDVARELLLSLPGIENRELINNRDKALCCGSGGLIKVNHPEVANDIANRLITQIVEQEVDICVNACPSCLLNIDENIKMQGLEIKTIDIAELVLDRTNNT